MKNKEIYLKQKKNKKTISVKIKLKHIGKIKTKFHLD